MTKIKLFFSIAMIFALLVGCSDTGKKEDGQINVYTTVFPIQYFTEQIGGEFVDVTSVYPPGTDEHTYDPSQKDMMAIADSDLFLYIGYGLEAFAKKAEKTLKNEDVTFIAIGEKIDLHSSHDKEDEHSEEDHDEHVGHHHGDIDPHVWLDPIYAKQLAHEIFDALSKEAPEHAEQFQTNLDELTKQLDQLHQDFKSVAENAKRKKFLVAHAAYGYWESRYDLEQISIAGISSTEEPSQRKLTNIVDMIKTEDIPYILFEQNINSKLAEIVQAETNIDKLYIHNLAVLTEKEIANEETYFTLMEKNIEVLEKALN